MNKTIRKFIIILFWLVAWHCLAGAVDNALLLAAPLQTAAKLISLLGQGSFYSTVGLSLLRISAGFAAGFCTAVYLAAASRRLPLLEEILSPIMTLIKAIPVASFAVLLLIWWGSSFLAVACCFLVTMPHIYISTLEGMKSTDYRLLEMAKVFRLPFWNRFFYIYLPALKPFMYSSMKISLGMCWKSGVAAEIIGVPDYSIGEQLYMSKIYLDTAGIFAWTAVTILLSVMFEKAIMWFVGRFFAWEPACRRQMGTDGAAGQPIKLTKLVKSYDGRMVLNQINAVYEPGQVYYLTSPSGSGKTTLLHILARLKEPDGGELAAPSGCSMVFQEDRLCEDYSAVKNIELITGDRERAEEALCLLLEKESLYKPCRQLSGGMKRRVALARAMESDSDYCLLDEPFAGLDADARRKAEEYIRQKQNGRILIIATHTK